MVTLINGNVLLVSKKKLRGNNCGKLVVSHLIDEHSRLHFLGKLKILQLLLFGELGN